MNKAAIKLEVFFEEPFWRGIFERTCEGRLSVSKVTFGAEPKGYEVIKFISENYYKLSYSPCVAASEQTKVRINPKRMQREIKKQLSNAGMGTKAQQALKLQQEQGKELHRACTNRRREAEKVFQFELKQKKKREKHKGR